MADYNYSRYSDCQCESPIDKLERAATKAPNVPTNESVRGYLVSTDHALFELRRSLSVSDDILFARGSVALDRCETPSEIEDECVLEILERHNKEVAEMLMIAEHIRSGLM